MLMIGSGSPAVHSQIRTADPHPEAYSALTRCRAIAENEARLACFDDAVGKLEAAINKRDLVVLDREHIRQTKKTLFGLSLPDLNLFGGQGRGEEELSSVDGVVAGSRMDENGGWILQLEGGATWRQIDSRPLGLPPRRGSKVVIKKAALGSYMMRIGGQPAIRVRRVS
ncbi:MAG: hypothetical protein JWN69_1887 [Alphaproteobacteria bacterium]|nr:hypothetical protein [Alphaproteobacteria bacterium]